MYYEQTWHAKFTGTKNYVKPVKKVVKNPYFQIQQFFIFFFPIAKNVHHHKKGS